MDYGDVVSNYMKEYTEEKNRRDEIIAKNKVVVLEALKNLGAVDVVVRYSGSGDSGQVDSVEVFGKGRDILDTKEMVSIVSESSHFDKENSKWVYTLTNEEVPLQEALDLLACDAVWVRHAGWENNDGASGELTINVSEGTFKLEHTEYYTESSTYDYEI